MQLGNNQVYSKLVVCVALNLPNCFSSNKHATRDMGYEIREAVRLQVNTGNERLGTHLSKEIPVSVKTLAATVTLAMKLLNLQ